MEMHKYLADIDETKITKTARVDIIWDEEGIWVDLNYSSDQIGGYGEYQTCFAALYTDDQDNRPNEKMWNLAMEVAMFIRDKYRMPLDVARKRR